MEQHRVSPEHLSQAVLADTSLRLAFSPPDREIIYRHGAIIGSEMHCFDEVPRCMDLARQQIMACEQAGHSFGSGTIFRAARLTGGVGRFRRQWHAPAGGLWLALVMVNTLLPESARLYSLAMGIACCETVRQFGLAARLKWVNDITVQGRKLAGVLTETMRGASGEEYIMLGLGLNVNNTEFPAELTETAASMAQLHGADFETNEVLAQLIVKLRWNIGLLHFYEEEALSQGVPTTGAHPLIESFRSLSDSVGKRVRFGYDVLVKPLYEAVALGIDNSGQLIMQLDDGQVIRENAGEIQYLS